MQTDPLGNTITPAFDDAAAGIADFVSGFLGFEARAGNILHAAEAAPDHALTQIYAAIVWQFAERPDAAAVARKFLDRAAPVLEDANEREQMTHAMVAAWVAGDLPQAERLANEIAAAHPRDLVAVKLVQNFAFNRGDAAAMLRVARAAEPESPDNPHLYAMLAFGYEQCHLLDKAERAASRALDLKWAEPWAQHALAHVMLTRGEIAEGAAFMDRASATWVGLNSFMYTHNWWHRALFEISLGNEQAVLDAYDSHVWAMDRDYSQDQIGAVALLARMEIAGFDVGERWSDLGQRLRARRTDVLSPFLSMQYLYGLAKAEQPEADELMAAVAERAARAQAFEVVAWREVAEPACRGLLAHARGQWHDAIAWLSRAMPRMAEAGGSHAQRDLFAQVLLDAHVKAGDYANAQQMLEARRRFDPNGVPLNRMLADCYEKLGLLEEAGEARGRSYV